MAEVDSPETCICCCLNNEVIAVGKNKQVDFFVSNTESTSGYKLIGALVMNFDILGLAAAGDTLCVTGRSECQLKKLCFREGILQIEDLSAFTLNETIQKSILCSDKLCFMLEKSVEIHWLDQDKQKVIKIDHSVTDLTSPDESLFFILTTDGHIAYCDVTQESVANEITVKLIDKFSDPSAISIFYSKHYELFLVGHKNKTCSSMKLKEENKMFEFDGLENLQVK